ncbi:pyridoxamine 5'-phosphate oxidase family protein [Kordiimonas marina]|uniref:pyridoxamine 5'-phosphate oxidase family protein n=1 Tax=Kordiimonas marina TaxID=2872312 RepID=UPI001FF0E1F5|nr:pyridoxamine 5'-phosphate oxidase family protein [Kordiimonas marina]MCJ9428296.1 pyridoxamine 5'-phosphate oxidase family protein [Kordiimonas marina]
MSDFVRHDRNRVRRGHKRATYDRDTVYAILDSHFLCHVGFEMDGQPHIIPTSHWREGNRLYWHGSSASRMIRHLAAGNPACVTVTQLDGLVLARSAFSTSVNYRSAVCYGTPGLVEDDAEFDRQMKLFFDRLAPGRWEQLRPMTDQERKATSMLVMEIDDAAAKVRATGPGDGEEADWPVWAGHVPLHTVQSVPVPAPEGARAPLDHPLMPAYGWRAETA